MSEIINLSDSDLYKLCQKYGLNARAWKKRFSGLLPEVNRRRLYRNHGFISIYEFANKMGGVSTYATDRILKLAERLKDKPLLRRQLETGEQGWSKIEKVSYIATPKTDKLWALRTKELSARALDSYVKGCRDLTIAGDKSPQIRLSFSVTEKTEHKLRVLKRDLEKKEKEPLSWNEVFQKIGASTNKEQIIVQVCPDCARRRGLKAKSRHIPQETRRLIIAKYQNKCGFPKCNKPHTEFHHTKRYALENKHDPKYIIPLCKYHHELMHAGLIGNEQHPPENWFLKKNSAPNLIDRKVQHHRKFP